MFHVDLVGSDLRMTGAPEPMPPIARVLMPDVEQHGYRVYPLVDHIADKVMATFQRYGGHQRPSTRYKDLVDLVSIVIGASVAAEPQLAALASEAHRRGVTLPARFDVPTGRCGSPATRPRRHGLCCRSHGSWKRGSLSFARASIRCSTERRSGRGIRTRDDGSRSRPGSTARR